MARKKKLKLKEVSTATTAPTIEIIEQVIDLPLKKEPIHHLPVDYPSEGLNNMAKKINELIDHHNA